MQITDRNQLNTSASSANQKPIRMRKAVIPIRRYFRSCTCTYRGVYGEGMQKGYMKGYIERVCRGSTQRGYMEGTWRGMHRGMQRGM